MVAPADVRDDPGSAPGSRTAAVASAPRALRVQAAHRGGVGDALDGQQVGGGAHVDRLPCAASSSVSSEGLDHDLLELLVDLASLQKSRLQVLDPLEVADRDAAGVAQDVRDQEDAALVEDLVGLGRRRAVGGLGDDLGLDRWPRCAAVIWFSSAAGTRMSQSSSRSSAFEMSSRPGSRDRPVLALPGDHPVDVEPGRVVDAAARVATRRRRSRPRRG